MVIVFKTSLIKRKFQRFFKNKNAVSKLNTKRPLMVYRYMQWHSDLQKQEETQSCWFQQLHLVHTDLLS